MRIIILECGGVIGPSLIHWLLRNTDATLAGSDDRHERLDDLLGLPRFSYYAMAPRREPELLDRFIAGADAVIDLSAIERRAAADEDVEDLERRLDLGAAVAHATAAAGARLVRVSAADAHDEDEPAGDTGLSGGSAVRRDEMFLAAEPQRASHTSGTGERMLQRPVHEDGASEGLDHVIVRVSNILGHGLETLPHRREPSILQALRQALRDGSGQTIRATADDYVMRSYLWVEDAAECVGRIATGKHGRCSHDVVTVGDPDNQASAIEVAQRIIRTYRERYWDGAGELPQLRVPALRIHRPVHAVPLPSVERARELIGWSPRFSMSDAVEAMLRGLMEPGPGRAQALRRMSLNPRRDLNLHSTSGT